MDLGDTDRIRFEAEGAVVLFEPRHPLFPAAVLAMAAGAMSLALLMGSIVMVLLVGLALWLVVWALLFESPHRHAELRVRGGELQVTGTGWRRRGTFRVPLEEVDVRLGERWLDPTSPNQHLRLHAPGWYRSDLKRLVEHLEAQRTTGERAMPAPEALQALRQRS